MPERPRVEETPELRAARQAVEDARSGVRDAWIPGNRPEEFTRSLDAFQAAVQRLCQELVRARAAGEAHMALPEEYERLVELMEPEQKSPRRFM